MNAIRRMCVVSKVLVKKGGGVLRFRARGPGAFVFFWVIGGGLQG